MTKAQQVYEQIEGLVASGMTKADAFKKLSEDTGQKLGTLRGAYYQFSKKENGGTTPRKRKTTPEDAVQSAIAALKAAIDNIDRELATAKTRADEAKAEYEALKAGAGEKKTAIEAKIAALEA